MNSQELNKSPTINDAINYMLLMLIRLNLPDAEWRAAEASIGGKLVAHVDGGLVNITTLRCTLCDGQIPQEMYSRLTLEGN